MDTKTGKDYALNVAIELCKTNIESTNAWVDPDFVIDFVEHVYNFLSTGEYKSE